MGILGFHLRGRNAGFVLLEHTWNGVHWDFMLEAATPCAPGRSTRPSFPEKISRAEPWATIARSTWNTKGPVARDRGSVRRIDAGTFQVRVWSGDHVQVALSGTQLVGEVVLRSAGRCRRERIVGLSARELGLKDLA